MAFHYNTAILKNLSDFWRLKGDALPSELDETIVPTFDVTPQFNVILEATASNATSATILTTPLDRDFYLCGFSTAHRRDATATATYSGLSVTVNGNVVILGKMLHRSLLAVTNYSPFTVFFPTPLKIDRGTTMDAINETNVAEVRQSVTIYGFYL